jgi:uncharacterized protein YggE
VTDRTVTMTGTGTANAPPDLLRLSMGVSVTLPDVASALAAANEAATSVQRALAESGVAHTDLQTIGFVIQPDYVYDGKEPPTLRGYQASQTIRAVLRDLDGAGAVIAAAATAGGDATRIGGMHFDVEDTSELLATARERAIADAQLKAQQFARAAGVELGRVLTITDPSEATILSVRAASLSASGSPVPLETGLHEVTVHVSVAWELD